VILLVEDEAPVRAFGSRALQMRGYQVMEADCAEAALQCLEDCDYQVDLVVSDVVMPGIDGPTWVREARKTRPDLPVVFVSGYAEYVFRKSKEEVGADRFLS
jgi:two-component system cell cycle sensor histidine kinase/response regulator CckA